MSFDKIKKNLETKIATLHQQWRATNDITFHKEAQQLQYAIDLIELEERKILEQIESLKNMDSALARLEAGTLRMVIGK